LPVKATDLLKMLTMCGVLLTKLRFGFKITKNNGKLYRKSSELSKNYGNFSTIKASLPTFPQ